MKLVTPSILVLACHDKSCAPPPVGTGGSDGGGGWAFNPTVKAKKAKWDADFRTDIKKPTPEMKKDYDAGWAAWKRGSIDALEKADKRGAPESWYHGFSDAGEYPIKPKYGTLFAQANGKIDEYDRGSWSPLKN